MSESITDDHITAEAEKILAVNGGMPDEILPSMVQTVIDNSSIPSETVNDMSEEEYKSLFNTTRDRLADALSQLSIEPVP